MKNAFELEQTFENQSISSNILAEEYEACTFKFCDFEGIFRTFRVFLITDIISYL